MVRGLIVALVVLGGAHHRGLLPIPPAGGGGAMSLFMGTGGPTDDGFTYRAQTDQGALLQLDYSVNSDLSGATRSTGVTTLSADNFTGGEAITGLNPATDYYVAVVVDGVRQHSAPYPTTRTAPAEGVDADVKFIAASCQKRSTDAVTGCWDAAVAEDADALGHLGDYAYGDHNTVATLRPAYQAEYTGDQQKITNKYARFQTKDDHDSAGNNSDGDTTGIELTRQVWKEYVPSFPLWDPDHHIGYSFPYANTDHFVLDTREQREGSRPRYPTTVGTFLSTESGTTTTEIKFPSSPSGPSDGALGQYAIIHDGVGGPKYYRRFTNWVGGATRVGTLDRAVPGLTAGWQFACKRASMLDMDVLPNGQVERLCAGIETSTKRWHFIWTSVIWNRRFVSAGGLNDCWAQWEPEWFEREYIRQRLAGIPNIIVISGDRHFSGLDSGELAPEGPDWPEATSSAFHRLPLETVCEWDHGSFDTGPSYVTIQVQTSPHQVTLAVKDNTGSVASGTTPLVVPDAS